jgi:hypothetical protein
MKESWFSNWLDIDVIEKKKIKKEKKDENNNNNNVFNTGKPDSNSTRLL